MSGLDLSTAAGIWMTISAAGLCVKYNMSFTFNRPFIAITFCKNNKAGPAVTAGSSFVVFLHGAEISHIHRISIVAASEIVHIIATLCHKTARVIGPLAYAAVEHISFPLF